jgi:hypothetical protein
VSSENEQESKIKATVMFWSGTLVTGYYFAIEISRHPVLNVFPRLICTAQFTGEFCSKKFVSRSTNRRWVTLDDLDMDTDTETEQT